MPSSSIADRMKYLNYHWFWGIRYNNPSQLVNMSTEVDSLLKNEGKLTRIQQSQFLLDRHHPGVRFFYWLFNVNNYTYHAYLLAAYKMQLDHSNDTVVDNVEMSTGYLVFDIITLGLTVAVRLKLHRCLLSSDSTASNTTAAASDSNSKKQPLPLCIEDKSIKITPIMLPHLEVLGIHSTAAESLHLSDIKSAYKSQSLRLHPDKGGTKEEFCRLNEAAAFLTSMMSYSENNEDKHQFDVSAFWEEIRDEAAAIRVEVTAIKAEFAKINTSMDEVEKVRATLDERDEQFEERAQRDKRELDAKLEELAQTAKRDKRELNAKLNKLTQTLTALQRRQDPNVVTHCLKFFDNVPQAGSTTDSTLSQKRLQNNQNVKKGEFF